MEKIDRAPCEKKATFARTAIAYAIHAYTASGAALAFAAAVEICARAPDPRRVFIYLFATVLIDATDGPLARRYNVKKWAARIDGRTIDDIVDYLTYTFLPLLLMWRMGWLPSPAGIWIVPALVASLFGFSNRAAKDEAGGFFLGFPSYWNIVAFYAGVWAGPKGVWFNAALVLALAILTVMPVRFLYPNLAPRPWRLTLLLGAGLWLALFIWMLIDYPHVAPALLWMSLIYPAFYTILSWRLAPAK